MKSKSAFLRTMILYRYVYNVDYSYLQKYNTELGKINPNLNQITKCIHFTGNIYEEDIKEVKELNHKLEKLNQYLEKDFITQPRKEKNIIYFNSN